MNYARQLKGVACRSCGEEALVWWWQNETEDTLELYVNCDECGREYPKRIVPKSEDTTDDALASIAREVAT